MTTTFDPPPVQKGRGFADLNFDDEQTIQFYLAYNYLPFRNLVGLLKNFNDLYELVYMVIHDEKLPKSYQLVLDSADTGNSIEIIGKLLDKVGLSKGASIALLIATVAIGTPVAIQYYKGQVAETENTRALTDKTLVETEQVKAETEKTKAETKNIGYRNMIDSMDIDERLKRKLKEEQNAKKIISKSKAVSRSVDNESIYQFKVNNKTIFYRQPI